MTQGIVRNFENGVGETLQEQLVERSKTTKNWVRNNVSFIDEIERGTVIGFRKIKKIMTPFVISWLSLCSHIDV